MIDNALNIANKAIRSEKFRIIKETILGYYTDNVYSNNPIIWILGKNKLKPPVWFNNLGQYNLPLDAQCLLADKITYDKDNFLQKVYIIWMNYSSTLDIDIQSGVDTQLYLIYSTPTLLILSVDITDSTVPLKIDNHMLMIFDKIKGEKLDTPNKTQLYFTTFEYTSNPYDLSDTDPLYEQNLRAIIAKEIPHTNEVDRIFDLINSMCDCKIIIVCSEPWREDILIKIKGYNST